MSTKQTISITLLLAVFFSLAFCGNKSNKDSNAETPVMNQVELSGVHKIIAWDSCKNLQIFLISGDAEINDKEYVALNEAMENKYITVFETGSVNELMVSNPSDHYIYVHAGDIVKGGRQDRTLSYDVIIPPKAKNLALNSFCVERSRWSKRGEEDDGYFHANSQIVSSRDLKVAAKYNADQSEVWQKVDAQQSELNENLSFAKNKQIDVTKNESATSLQLSLENEDLKDLKAEFKAKLFKLLKENPEATGFAYAINGEVYGIDIYNNKKLFADLWEKLLDASIVEAISNLIKGEKYTPATGKDIITLVNGLENKKQESKEVNSETLLETCRTDSTILFETIDVKMDKWIHKNYIAVDPDETNLDKTEANRDQIQLIQSNSLNNANLNEQIQVQQEVIYNDDEVIE